MADERIRLKVQTRPHRWRDAVQRLRATVELTAAFMMLATGAWRLTTGEASLWRLAVGAGQLFTAAWLLLPYLHRPGDRS